MIKSDIQYYQCRLRQEERSLVTTGWIEERGAKVGAKVELLPSKEFWEVVEVYDVPLSNEVLRETQRQRRAGLPSLKK